MRPPVETGRPGRGFFGLQRRASAVVEDAARHAADAGRVGEVLDEDVVDLFARVDERRCAERRAVRTPQRERLDRLPGETDFRIRRLAEIRVVLVAPRERQIERAESPVIDCALPTIGTYSSANTERL